MYGWTPSPAPPTHSNNVGGELMPDEFGTEPLVGYRSWLVVNAGDGTGLALKSLHVSYLWERQVEAICHQQAIMFRRDLHPDRISPALTCSCGIYAQLPDQPISEWEHARRGRVYASGTIAMWGRIIECQRGYKAQYAQIQSPIVLDLSCVNGCTNPPSKVALPDHQWSVFNAYCTEHAVAASQTVKIQYDVWLGEARKRLSQRYQLEVLTWK